MADKIREIIAEVLGVPVAQITDDLAVGDIPQWDSLRHLHIMKGLEAEYSIEIPPATAAEFEDVSDIIAAVEELVA